MAWPQAAEDATLWYQSNFFYFVGNGVHYTNSTRDITNVENYKRQDEAVMEKTTYKKDLKRIKQFPRPSRVPTSERTSSSNKCKTSFNFQGQNQDHQVDHHNATWYSILKFLV